MIPQTCDKFFKMICRLLSQCQPYLCCVEPCFTADGKQSSYSINPFVTTSIVYDGNSHGCLESKTPRRIKRKYLFTKGRCGGSLKLCVQNRHFHNTCGLFLRQSKNLFQCGGSVSGSNGPHAPLSPTALQNSIPHNVSAIYLYYFCFTYLRMKLFGLRALHSTTCIMVFFVSCFCACSVFFYISCI